MKLHIVAVVLLMVSNASAQDPCSEWARTPGYKSKADCEEQVKAVTEWNSFCVKAQEKAGPYPENLSAADGSAYAFCRIQDAKEITNTEVSSHKNNQKVQESWKKWRAEVLPRWADTKDIFCLFHASAAYLADGDHISAHCGADEHYGGVPDKQTMDKLFGEDDALSANVETFSASQTCEDMADGNEQKACMQRQVDAYKPLLDAIKKQKK